MTSGTADVEVVYGNPDDSELAAVMCVLLAASSGMPHGEALGQALSAAPGGNQKPLRRVFWRIEPTTSRPNTFVSVASGIGARRRRRRVRTMRTHSIWR